MYSRTISALKYLPQQMLCYQKLINVNKTQQCIFSAKPPLQPLQKKSVDGEPLKRPKTLLIPKITLIASDESITIVTLEEAQHLSKRRDLKLVKIVDLDTKTQRPVYKLMTGTEYHAEDIKQREERKKAKQLGNNAIKGEKLLMLNAGITEHDLETNIKRVVKWVDKRYEVRVVINGDMTKAERVYSFLEGKLKDQTRFLQKRSKGNDLKFQIHPTKDKENSSNSSSTSGGNKTL